jgi:putative membrane protein
MLELGKLFLRVVFDVWSLSSIRKTTFLTLIAGAYFFFIEYVESNIYFIDFYIPSYIFYLLGYVLVMLFYFKVNTAYYRWYDGRKYWSYLGTHGKNLADKMNAILPPDDKENRYFFAKMIVNHAYALKANLRRIRSLDEIYEVYPGFKDSLKDVKDIPTHLISLILERLTELYRNKQISDYMYLGLHKYVDEAIDIDEQCRGIRKVPSPSTYTMHLKTYLFLFTATLPFGFVHDHNALIIFVMMVIFGAYVGTMIVSEEIDEPFGTDKYDIPLEDICYSLKKHVHQLLKVELPKESHAHH